MEKSYVHFLAQLQVMEDFKAKQGNIHQLAKLLAGMVDTQDNVS